MPDGGLNCEATAYSKAAPKSSLVSTLPPLEAVLIHTHRAFTPAEEQFLDRGASYLIERRLFRARGQGNRVMDPEWLKPVFPRFWAYDILRGLSWLARWAEVRGKPLPADSVREAIDTVRSQVVDGGMTVGRRLHDRTMRCDADGTWTWGHPTSTFPLLDACSAVGAASPYLGQIWRATHERLERLRANGQLDSLS